MKKDRQLTGQGKRLAELLEMQFSGQREMAEFLGTSQPNLNRLFGFAELPRSFWGKYADKLPRAGLNPGYISDPDNHAPMFEEAAEAYLAKVVEKLKLRKTA
jgi:hypothetical protein